MALATPDQVDDVLSGDVLGHLDVQLVSAARLLEVVLEQGAAIRARDVQPVATPPASCRPNSPPRAIEEERTRLLERSGRGSAHPAVTLRH